MNEQQLDAELADWFSHQRRIDAANAPEFADVLIRVRIEHERAQRQSSLRRVAAIAAMFVLSGILIHMTGLRFTPRPSAQNESLAVPWRTTVLVSEWRAPTDFLFAAPNAGFASLAREAQRWNNDSMFRPNQIN